MCWTLLSAAIIGSANAAAAADLTIGINLPQTGPGSSFGVPMRPARSPRTRASRKATWGWARPTNGNS